MANKVLHKILFYGAVILMVIACTEPYEFKDPVFESALVVEATITDENKQQSVMVSRSFPLDTIIMSGESDAVVQITDDTGAVFGFDHQGGGEYLSRVPFAAAEGRAYTLSITTSDGNSYVSETSSIRAGSLIENVYAVREIADDQIEGVFIYVDSYDPSNSATYYKYEYEETYKIIAPFYIYDLEAYVIAPLPFPEVGLRPRSREEKTCYATELSKNIIQTSTADLNEDRVSRFPVRFISRENFIISHRYSILVKQYVQSREAFTYYATLKSLSSSESLFSQLQTGFLEGNIRSEQNESEKVIGFFEVSSVSQKRIFFDYQDLFPGEELPDYLIDCMITSPPLINIAGTSPLIDGIEFGLYDYYDNYDTEINPLNFEEYGPYLMVTAGCGDCTEVGSNIVPAFWEE